MDNLWYILSILCLVGTFAPLLPSDYWLVKSQEYLKYYYLIGSVILLLVGVIFMSYTPTFLAVVALLGTGIIHCNIKISPYTPLAKTMVEIAKKNPAKKTLRLLIFNVYQDNDAYAKLISLIDETEPDLISLFEVNREWATNLAWIKSTYKYRVERILENKYGIMLLSKTPLEESAINEFVKEQIPSTEVLLDMNGQKLRILGIHPKPPVLGEALYVTDKNREFKKVYKYIETLDPVEHVIVHGDLNDVAWGKYPRRLKNKANLRDPRIGRGFYPTFPTYFPLKIPLDHLYISSKIELVDFKLLRDIGSDHFPVYAEIQL